MTSNPIPKCLSCSAPGSTQCGGCKAVVYCGSTCQQTHWPFHKNNCKDLRRYPPPPAGFFISCAPFESLTTIQILPSGRPAYPSPWALARARITPPDIPFRGSASGRYQLDLDEPERTEPGARNLYEGLGKELAYMKIVDAYRMRCSSFVQGDSESASQAEKIMFTPSLSTFLHTYLVPLTQLPATRRATLLPPSFPATATPALVDEFVRICQSFDTKLDAPATRDELFTLGIFGGMRDLKLITQGALDGQAVMLEERGLPTGR